MFLLLHYKGAYEELILPKRDEILQNRKVGKRRYIVALFTDKSGMNPKENPAIGELAVNIHTAIDQERKLNQNAENALSNLTSNIGKIVQGIMNDVV